MTNEMEDVCCLTQEHGGDVAFIVNHSGGKDSTRMLGLVRQKFPERPTYAVMADTGFEHKSPISAADWARLRSAEFGLDLTVVRNPKRTYLEMVERRGMFPSPQFRQCTSDLRRGPIEKFIRSLPHRIIVNCIGIRAEESTTRARSSPWSVNRSLTTSRRTVYNWFPIYEKTLFDVLAWHWVNAIRLHPVTAMNVGAITFAGVPLYRVTVGYPLESASTTVLFAALLASLVRVWLVAFRPHAR